MTRTLRIPLLLAVLSMAILSCDGKRVYEKNLELDKGEWPKDKALEFEFEIANTSELYNVLVNVRNGNDYPYSNLYLYIEMQSPDEKYYSDTLEFQMADNTGRWTGSGIGSNWINQFPLLQGVKILVPGQYKVIIKQGMREDTLRAISDVGIRIEKS